MKALDRSRQHRIGEMTFLWRLTLVTLVAAAVLTLLLVTLMERAHREAVITDYEVTTVRAVTAAFATPLDALAQRGPSDAGVRRALDAAATAARRFDAVTGVRIYDPLGRPVYPAGTAPAPQEVAWALAAGHEVPIDTGPVVRVFEPYRTPNAQLYAVDVEFTSVRLRAAERGRGQVFSLAGIVAAVICVSLVVLAVGAGHEMQRRRTFARESFVETLAVMADAIDVRDAYTAGHSKRVAVYSRKLAAALGLTPDEVETIENGALLHDLGKIGVPDSVLFKPGPLDDGERATIAAHPVLGARLVGGMTEMAAIVPCVLHHHERLDGSGYPAGLAGDAIPLGARIIAVADTFDAITTDRPYRRAGSVDDAVREIARVAGSQLDARAARTFIDLIACGKLERIPHPAPVPGTATP